jgi:hypothetical protein
MPKDFASKCSDTRRSSASQMGMRRIDRGASALHLLRACAVGLIGLQVGCGDSSKVAQPTASPVPNLLLGAWISIPNERESIVFTTNGQVKHREKTIDSVWPLQKMMTWTVTKTFPYELADAKTVVFNFSNSEVENDHRRIDYQVGGDELRLDGARYKRLANSPLGGEDEFTAEGLRKARDEYFHRLGGDALFAAVTESTDDPRADPIDRLKKELSASEGEGYIEGKAVVVRMDAKSIDYYLTGELPLELRALGGDDLGTIIQLYKGADNVTGRYTDGSVAIQETLIVT